MEVCKKIHPATQNPLSPGKIKYFLILLVEMTKIDILALMQVCKKSQVVQPKSQMEQPNRLIINAAVRGY